MLLLLQFNSKKSSTCLELQQATGMNQADVVHNLQVFVTILKACFDALCVHIKPADITVTCVRDEPLDSYEGANSKHDMP